MKFLCILWTNECIFGIVNVVYNQIGSFELVSVVDEPFSLDYEHFMYYLNF